MPRRTNHRENKVRKELEDRIHQRGPAIAEAKLAFSDARRGIENASTPAEKKKALAVAERAMEKWDSVKKLHGRTDPALLALEGEAERVQSVLDRYRMAEAGSRKRASRTDHVSAVIKMAAQIGEKHGLLGKKMIKNEPSEPAAVREMQEWFLKRILPETGLSGEKRKKLRETMTKPYAEIESGEIYSAGLEMLKKIANILPEAIRRSEGSTQHILREALGEMRERLSEEMEYCREHK